VLAAGLMRALGFLLLLLALVMLVAYCTAQLF
jgi:hypothetical protein